MKFKISAAAWLVIIMYAFMILCIGIYMF